VCKVQKTERTILGIVRSLILTFVKVWHFSTFACVLTGFLVPSSECR